MNWMNRVKSWADLKGYEQTANIIVHINPSGKLLLTTHKTVYRKSTIRKALSQLDKGKSNVFINGYCRQCAIETKSGKFQLRANPGRNGTIIVGCSVLSKKFVDEIRKWAQSGK